MPAEYTRVASRDGSDGGRTTGVISAGLRFCGSGAGDHGTNERARSRLVKQVVEPLLVDEDYVERLKGLGGQRGLKFKEYRVVRVRLGRVSRRTEW